MAEAHMVDRWALWPDSCFYFLALVLLGTRFVQALDGVIGPKGWQPSGFGPPMATKH
jgi:hypothetical protein